MRIRNFTLEGSRLTLIARTAGKKPVYDLECDVTQFSGMTFDQLRAELCTIKKDIDGLLSSHDVENFNTDWSGKVLIDDGKGGFTWGYPCDDHAHRA